jgi:hypothetical protein
MRYTNLGRTIDFSYPTNVVVTILSCLAVTAGFIYQLVIGSAWIEGLIWGGILGLTIFLTWALTREVDPDEPYSAFLSAAAALASAILLAMPNLLATLWLILILRMVNRVIGSRATWLDSLMVFGLGLFLAFELGWPYGFASAIAFAMDSRLPQRHKIHLWFANAALFVSLIAAIFGPPLKPTGGWSAIRLLSVFGSTLLFVLVILCSRRVTGVADRTGAPLHPLRVQAAQILCVVIGLLGAWWGGWMEVIILGPLWAAMLGVSLYHVLVVLPGRVLRNRPASS